MNEEEKLIKRIKRYQDRDAAGKLINIYYDEIYRYVFRQCGDKNNSLDIVQEIFITMLKAVNSFDSKKASFRTFLYRVATNKLIDIRRKWQKTSTHVSLPYEESIIEGAIFSEETDYAESLNDEELLYKIEEYVRGLESGPQQIFRLHVYGEYTFAEIAGIQGVPEASVKTKYYRMMKKIKEEFSNEYYDSQR